MSVAVIPEAVQGEVNIVVVVVVVAVVVFCSVLHTLDLLSFIHRHRNWDSNYPEAQVRDLRRRINCGQLNHAIFYIHDKGRERLKNSPGSQFLLESTVAAIMSHVSALV